MNDLERAWLDKASRYGGDFVKSFATACFMADDHNFLILRPALALLMKRYPSYSTNRGL